MPKQQHISNPFPKQNQPIAITRAMPSSRGCSRRARTGKLARGFLETTLSSNSRPMHSKKRAELASKLWSWVWPQA